MASEHNKCLYGKHDCRKICLCEKKIVSLQRIVDMVCIAMNVKTLIYRMVAWIRHRLGARNSGGHGIHSPYLFEWVRMVMSDENQYYVWDEIEKIRMALLNDTSELEYVDYGSGAKEKGEVSTKRVCDIAARSLESAKYGRMLFRLVNWLGHTKRCTEGKGLKIIELGTSLGVTTAYLAAANKGDEVVTYEGCSAVAKIARKGWKQLGMNNIRCVEGDIDDTLLLNAPVSAHAREEIDVAFVDANHTYEATCRYFEELSKRVHAKSVVVVDDIYYNKEMERAWKWICARPEVTSTMDLYKMGMVFFDPNYLRKNYRLRM